MASTTHSMMDEMLEFLGATPGIFGRPQAVINPANLPILPNAQAEPVVPTEKKRKHKITEQKGRQKINDQINELKSMLPECRYVNTTKASVLECTVNAMKRLQSLGTQLMTANGKLQKENKRLRAVLEKYDPAAANSWDLNDPDLDLPDDIIPNLASQNILGSLTDLLPSDPSSGISSPLDESSYLSSAEYSGMPTSSPPSSSPPITSFNYIQSVTQEPPRTQFSSLPYSDDFTANPSGYKFSKRRLLLVVLLIVPFFVSFDSLMQPQPSLLSTSEPSSFRTLLEKSSPAEVFAAVYYLDIARFAFYFVLGAVGIHWTANTVKWFNQMQPEYSAPSTKGTC